MGFDYIWGDALAELSQGDLRIINLETSITSSAVYWPGKGIHYRMHPRNTGCLTAAKIDACCLANNHVLDWSRPGLAETLASLNKAGIAVAGAGRNAMEAAAPAILETKDKRRILLFSYGSITSGIPPEWAATGTLPGVNLLEDLSETTARRIASEMQRFRKPGDLLVASIHWGNNWGSELPEAQIAFAHQLIEEGVTIVHGHSSHHVKTLEIYQDHLILYGCGDFLTDYEGITGYESYRGDLAVSYLVQVDWEGRVLAVRMVPWQMHQFRLRRASAGDAQWLCNLLNGLGENPAPKCSWRKTTA